MMEGVIQRGTAKSLKDLKIHLQVKQVQLMITKMLGLLAIHLI